MTDEKLLQEVRARAMGMGFNARWLILELANRYEMAQVEIKRQKEAYLACEETTGIKQAKAEAIKEFMKRANEKAEFLKDDDDYIGYAECVRVCYLESIAKEIVGDSK